MAILFSFAACNNSSSSSGEVEPEILATFSLNEDTIRLYDDYTFTITLKGNAGTISGTYAYISKGYKLMVGKASSDIANSGNILKLEVADGKVSVTYSDIARYFLGDSGEQTDGNSSGGDNQGNAGADSDYSLGDAPESYRLSEKYFEVKECAEGIYLEFTVLAGTEHFRAYIDEIGQVSEELRYKKDSNNKGLFFYPFLAPGKEYTVRIVFMRAEDKDKDDFSLNYIDGDGIIGWFETKIKAGANSKGEVRIQDCGEMEVKPNGDFKFTKMPKFENEENFAKSGHSWIMDLALVEGVSWMHEGRKTKWRAVAELTQESLTKTQNLYTIEYGWKVNEPFEIGFICYRPILYYEYGGNTYKYLWWSGTHDTPDLKKEDDLWTNIDITKSADVAKIKGTWTMKMWEGNYDWYDIPCYDVDTETLVIDGGNVKRTVYYTYTKLNGAFTEAELNLFGSNVTVSSDRKTAVEKYEYDEQSLTEYLADERTTLNYVDGSMREVTIHYSFRLFNDGSVLRKIKSYEFDDGGPDEYSYYDYKKQ